MYSPPSKKDFYSILAIKQYQELILRKWLFIVIQTILYWKTLFFSSETIFLLWRNTSRTLIWDNLVRQSFLKRPVLKNLTYLFLECLRNIFSSIALVQPFCSELSVKVSGLLLLQELIPLYKASVLWTKQLIQFRS